MTATGRRTEMGQKVNPYGFRLGCHDRLEVALVRGPPLPGLRHRGLEDPRLPDVQLEAAAVSRIEIERTRDRLRVDIHTARPGIVIGRGDRKPTASRRSSKRSRDSATASSSTSKRSSSPSSTLR